MYIYTRSLPGGMGVGVRSMPTVSFVRGVRYCKTRIPLEPKGTSLVTHPDAFNEDI